MSRKNSESVVCEFDFLCPGVCLESLTAKKKGRKKKIKKMVGKGKRTTLALH